MAPAVEVRHQQAGHGRLADRADRRDGIFPAWTKGDEMEDGDNNPLAHHRRRRLGGVGRDRGGALLGPKDRPRLGGIPPRRPGPGGLLGLLHDVTAPVIGNFVGPIVGDGKPEPFKQEPGDEQSSDDNNDSDSDESQPEGPSDLIKPPTSTKGPSLPPPPPPPADNPPPATKPPIIINPDLAPETPEQPKSSQAQDATETSTIKMSMTTLVPGAKLPTTIASDSLEPTATTALLTNPTNTEGRSSSNTPIPTAPLPTTSSGFRKGIITGPIPVLDGGLDTSSAVSGFATTTTSARSKATADAEAAENHPNHGLSKSGQNGLIAGGTIGLVLFLCVIGWFLWRRIKGSSKRDTNDRTRDLPSSSPLEKPKRRILAAVSGIPFIRTRSRDRGWLDLGSPQEDQFKEKMAAAAAASPATEANKNEIVVHTAFTRKSGYEDDAALHPLRQHPNQADSTTQCHFIPGLRQNTQYINIRASFVSSLSSGFGDGDIVMPPALAKLNAQQRLSAVTDGTSGDEESRKRDTISTQSSEDSAPRFRTVSSWVRQQSVRVKKDRLRDTTDPDAPPVPEIPPEQEYNLVMPDGEVPRRVEPTVTTGIAK